MIFNNHPKDTVELVMPVLIGWLGILSVKHALHLQF